MLDPNKKNMMSGLIYGNLAKKTKHITNINMNMLIGITARNNRSVGVFRSFVINFVVKYTATNA